ncbi:MAG: hypothetical protein ACKOPT_00600, partial [Cyanobium sp.]
FSTLTSAGSGWRSYTNRRRKSSAHYSDSLIGPALEQLVEQLPAAQVTSLRLTVLEGLSLRAAAAQLQISPLAVSHREVRLATLQAQKKALAALRQQLVGAG